MPIETFNYLNSLVPDNPVISDGVNAGATHIRGIKLALKNTFPNITGAITATQGDLNAVAGGASVLADAGAMFKTNTTDGFKSPLAGDIDVILQGTVAATFQRTGGANFFKVNGGIQATGTISGPGVTPIGAAVMWFEDTLPGDGLWCWANGGIINNANTWAPVLLARWGNRYGGNGVTTMGVPDLRETVPVGKSTMGGTVARGLLWPIASALLNTLGSVFGTAGYALLRSDLPNVAPTFSGATTPVSVSGTVNGFLASNTFNTGTAPNPCNYGTNTTLTISASGSCVPQGNVGSINGGVGQTAFSLVQPSTTVNWIIRLG